MALRGVALHQVSLLPHPPVHLRAIVVDLTSPPPIVYTQFSLSGGQWAVYPAHTSCHAQSVVYSWSENAFQEGLL